MNLSNTKTFDSLRQYYQFVLEVELKRVVPSSLSKVIWIQTFSFARFNYKIINY